MAKQKTQIKLDLSPEKVRRFDLRNSKYNVTSKDLASLGVSMDSALMPDIKAHFGTTYSLDGNPLQTSSSVSNPVQFFQYWAPEAVEIATCARKIDDIAGRTIAGSFEDEEIVTTILERTGSAQPYTDTADVPFASWNQNFETRSIVRFEEGFEIGALEGMRASRMQVDTHKEKSAAVAESLAIEMNNIGFWGYADGENKTYGLLNEPNLPAYVTVAEGAQSDTSWNSKTFAEITSDIITAVSALVNRLGGLFDPINDEFTLSLALAASQSLNIMNELGSKSVYSWLKETYPKIRIIPAIELNGANGGSNVFYLHVSKVNGKDVIKQYIADALRLIGVERRAKTTIEDYACATAGVLVQQPVGVVRYSGI